MTWGFFFLKNCVFIDESDFDISMRPSTVRSIQSAPVIATMPLMKTVSHSVLDVISTFGVLNIKTRVFQSPKKKRKVESGPKRKAGG